MGLHHLGGIGLQPLHFVQELALVTSQLVTLLADFGERLVGLHHLGGLRL